ncbi:hypothetical protein HPP92_001365 [Vanilla planifolia]|uniref:Uncharacterized protein n=1 Tax=Vanilla planifolia TaxID=51239 RepID=A0A835VDH2_VANPL|nr:hypothetical protein HPP92_001365 [Vanilla planifolia]
MTSWRISSNLGLPKWCTKLSFLPVKKLSITITLSPLAINLSTRWLPTKPAPPVTTIRKGAFLSPTVTLLAPAPRASMGKAEVETVDAESLAVAERWGRGSVGLMTGV